MIERQIVGRCLLMLGAWRWVIWLVLVIGVWRLVGGGGGCMLDDGSEFCGSMDMRISMDATVWAGGRTGAQAQIGPRFLGPIYKNRSSETLTRAP